MARLQHGAAPAGKTMLEFGDFRFDPERGLSRHGRPVRLARKEERGLALLLSRRGAVVSRDEYVHAVWPRSGIASEASIARSVYLVRRALAGAGGRDIVETVYGHGFRIAVPVDEVRVRRSERPTHRAAIETLAIGQQLLGQHAPADLAAAMGAFRRALALDAKSVSACTAIAHCAIAQTVRGSTDPLAVARFALPYAEQALAMDPEAAGAIAARGWLRGIIHGRIDEGATDLDRAIALDPEHWLARSYRAWLVAASGDPREALAEARRAMALTPLHPSPRALAGWLLFCSGRSDEALALLQTALDELGDRGEVLRVLSAVHAHAGRSTASLDAARRASATDRTPLQESISLAYALACAGDRRGAASLVRRAARSGPITHVAAVYLALGDRARAVDALAQARVRACPYRFFVPDDPRLAALRWKAAGVAA